MSKSKNDLMLKYLKENDPNIFEVKSIGLKDWDDDDGPMGEHYIVEVREYWMNPEILGHDMRGSKYLVDKSIFELWNKQKNAIKKVRDVHIK
jgi:hypothetical protein